MRSLIFILSFLVLTPLHAVFAADANSDEENQIRQKVRTHAYPGGADEESLKVQEQLPIIGRKMQPAQEPVEQDDAATSDAKD
jgi:hypothetical protein